MTADPSPLDLLAIDLDRRLGQVDLARPEVRELLVRALICGQVALDFAYPATRCPADDEGFKLLRAAVVRLRRHDSRAGLWLLRHPLAGNGGQLDGSVRPVRNPP